MSIKSKLSCLLALPLLSAVGCCTPGFHWGFNLPSTAYAPALVNQRSGDSTIAPLAAYPAEPVGRPGGQLAYLPEPVEAIRRPTLAATPSCTMADICNMLERIERRLATQAAPMPKLNPNE